LSDGHHSETRPEVPIISEEKNVARTDDINQPPSSYNYHSDRVIEVPIRSEEKDVALTRSKTSDGYHYDKPKVSFDQEEKFAVTIVAEIQPTYLPPKATYLPPKANYLPPKADLLPPKTN
jgi:hypothetical protein